MRNAGRWTGHDETMHDRETRCWTRTTATRWSLRHSGAGNRQSGGKKKEAPEPVPCIRLAIRNWPGLDLIDDLAACVSSLTFCGNLVPVSVQSQGDLMKVARSWKGTLWKSAVEMGLERPRCFRSQAISVRRLLIVSGRAQKAHRRRSGRRGCGRRGERTGRYRLRA